MCLGSDPTTQRRSECLTLPAAPLCWMFDGFEIRIFSLVRPTSLDVPPSRELPANPTVNEGLVQRRQVRCSLLARPANFYQRHHCSRRSHLPVYASDSIVNKVLHIQRRLYDTGQFLCNLSFE
jgi:hypothetical protein